MVNLRINQPFAPWMRLGFLRFFPVVGVKITVITTTPPEPSEPGKGSPVVNLSEDIFAGGESGGVPFRGARGEHFEPRKKTCCFFCDYIGDYILHTYI